MQLSTLLSWVLLICTCVAESGIDTHHVLVVRAPQRPSSAPILKAEASKSQRLHVRSLFQNPRKQEKPSLSKLQRQNSAPTTKSDINTAKKQVQSSSQDEKSALVADLVLGKLKDRTKASTALSLASRKKALDWHRQVNAHFVTSWKAHQKKNEEALKRSNQRINWKAAMARIHRHKADDYANDAREATGLARKMEISGISLRGGRG